MKNKDVKILLVDDEPDILEIVGYNLKREGYQIIEAKNGEEGLELAIKERPHLIILDIMMPKMDGIEMCKKVRAVESLKDTLITFFTARGEDFSKLAGFDVGADDYITKPIKPKILVSKVGALLRRLKSHHTSSVVEIGDIIIDRERYIIIKSGNEISLPRKQFELFSLLASKPSKVFEREVILDSVWGQEVVVGDRTIDVHIRKLREAIGEKYFKTVKGVGYKYVVNED
ncbi:MAG: response regulator transcription factor [Flavobacteriaceae bacterium]|nr:response regulator transcription factor [Flavobacteriaceae bacterium]